MSCPAFDRPIRRAAMLFGASLLCTLFTGCQPAMSTSAAGTSRVVRNEFPLKFKKHNFQAICYDTYGCRVTYAGTVEREDDDAKLAPPATANRRERWGFASHVGIENFPGPAVVNWKSRDGTAHRAEVDIAGLFEDELVRHNVPQAEIPLETAAMPGGPDIFLEVNDRTISVLMKATIAIKGDASHHGGFVSELVPVWSRTY